MATYQTVVWTAGDVITEAKLDNMVSNDQSENAHAANGYIANNNVYYYAKDTGGTNRIVAYVTTNDVMKIGNSAIDTAFVTRIKARAYPTSNQTGVATDTQVTLGTEDYDTGADFASNTYTVPVTGYYFIGGKITCSVTTVEANKEYICIIKVNDATALTGYSHSSLVKAVTPMVADIIKLTVADTVKLYLQHGATGNQTILAGSLYTFLACHLVSLD